jgi:hypothetical protein
MRLAVLALAGALMLAAHEALAAEADEGGLFRGVRMELGPVRWSGALGTEYRLQQASGHGRTPSRVDFANLRAASYLWQPWFAQLRGGLGLVRGASDGGTSSRSSSMTGEAGVSLFPMSRFPFDAHASVTDSRASGEFTSSDYRTLRYGLQQAYRTPEGGTNYTARYDRSVLDSQSFGRDTLDVLEASMTRRIGLQVLELNGSLSENRGGIGGTSSRLERASARHAFAPSSNTTLESLASVNRMRAEGGQGAAFNTRFTQFTTFGTWRPDEESTWFDEQRPLVVMASGRWSALANDTGATSSDVTTANATVGANYTVNRDTRLTANATATHSSGATTDTLFTSESASLFYSPLAKPLGDWLYTWSAGGSAGNTTSTGEGAEQTYTAQLSHGLSRSVEFSPGTRVSVVAGQSAGGSVNPGHDSTTLAHNAGINWSAANGGGSQSYIGFTAADTRSYGATQSAFQLVNLQASRQQAVSTLSTWTGNFTLQGTRQPASDVEGFNWSKTGSLTYQHRRAFGVARLRFSAIYTASQQQLASRANGDIDASRDFVSQSAEGRFDYVIGKLELRLSARVAEVSGQRNTLLFLRAVRHF